jgi:hypothetical protein
MQTARLHVTNHSNKNIRMLGMKLDYIGPDGKRLRGRDGADRWGTPWRAGGQSADSNPILVAKRATFAFEIDAPFLTKGNKTIAVSVRTVGFADAETWTAPSATKK